MDQYIGNLRQYRAIAIDVGDIDGRCFYAMRYVEGYSLNAVLRAVKPGGIVIVEF